LATDALTSTDITSGVPTLDSPELVSGRPLIGQPFSQQGGAKLATQYTAGDDTDIGVTMLRNNEPDIEASSSWETVYASIKDELGDTAQELAGPWQCYEDHPDARWDSEAFVIVPFVGADTASITPGDYWLEVTAVIGAGELTYHGKLKVLSGVITGLTGVT